MRIEPRAVIISEEVEARVPFYGTPAAKELLKNIKAPFSSNWRNLYYRAELLKHYTLSVMLGQTWESMKRIVSDTVGAV